MIANPTAWDIIWRDVANFVLPNRSRARFRRKPGKFSRSKVSRALSRHNLRTLLCNVIIIHFPTRALIAPLRAITPRAFNRPALRATLDVRNKRDGPFISSALTYLVRVVRYTPFAATITTAEKDSDRYIDLRVTASDRIAGADWSSAHTRSRWISKARRDIVIGDETALIRKVWSYTVLRVLGEQRYHSTTIQITLREQNR